MVIYVVQPGDTLWLIARRFGVSVAGIVMANGLPNPNRLVPGLALVIPTAGPERTRTNLEVFGYYILPPDQARINTDITALGPYLTYLGVFHYPVQPDGSLAMLDATRAVEAAYRNRVAPVAVITNFRGETFNSELAHTILVNPALRSQVVRNIRTLVETGGFAGVNLDWENLFPADRALYNTFVREMAAALRPRYFLSVAVAPKWEDAPERPWTGAHDYATLGNIADFMVIMTYEWGWVGGPPQAVAPANLVRRVLEYAVSLVPANKIMMGMNLYGYDWPLPHTPEARATTRPALNAQNNALTHYSAINFQVVSQSPWYRYRDAGGRRHEVWFEDVRSFQARYLIAQELRLRGVSWWLMNYRFPQNLELVRNMFNVVKRV
ncbi:MAG: glycosyl hydrolase family 18 protein [Heliobacteriaceae bacterium]|nr:glycosyl hydrolase family 18 protein [Heliobacteriaceae bacterium]